MVTCAGLETNGAGWAVSAMLSTVRTGTEYSVIVYYVST